MTLRRILAVSCLCVLACAGAALAQDGWEGAFDAKGGRKPAPERVREPLPQLVLAAETVAPGYPEAAAAGGSEGVVALSFVVKADGGVHPRSVRIAESSGVQILDDQARAWIRTLRFMPLDKAKGGSIGQYFRVAFSLAGGKPSVSATSVRLIPPALDPNRPIGRPPYPPDALKAREQGVAVLEFKVRPDGFLDPATIRVARSSGSATLDDAAVADARTTWRLLPATDEEQRPVAAWFQYNAEFKPPNR